MPASTGRAKGSAPLAGEWGLISTIANRMLGVILSLAECDSPLRPWAAGGRLQPGHPTNRVFMAETIQVDYDALAALAADIRQQADDMRALLRKLSAQTDVVEASWVGESARGFQTEAKDVLLPAMERLQLGLDQAGVTITQISERMRTAEEEAAALFAGIAAGGFLSGVADFFSGAWAELKDMGAGLLNLLKDPIGTAGGILQAIRRPDLLWEALKQPYVEAWESGHPWQAIGRGTMFIGSIVLGTKGADKVSKFAKAARAGRVSTEAAEAGARAGSVGNAAREIGTVAKGSRAETALARYIAGESTTTYQGVERVVLGANTPDKVRGFLGYVREAETHGGTVFNTTDDVWRTIGPDGANRGWAVNREFLQGQLEHGAPAFDLRGSSVSETLTMRPTSGAASEIRYLQRYGYEYGYRQVGDSWVKVGDWRAGTTGRVVGGSVGPFADVIEDTSPNP